MEGKSLKSLLNLIDNSVSKRCFKELKNAIF